MIFVTKIYIGYECDSESLYVIGPQSFDSAPDILQPTKHYIWAVACTCNTAHSENVKCCNLIYRGTLETGRSLSKVKYLCGIALWWTLDVYIYFQTFSLG